MTITDDDVKLVIRSWELCLRLDCGKIWETPVFDQVYNTLNNPIVANVTENIAERLDNSLLLLL